ncbi:MAG: hypothetical protein COB98_05670 [Flavobacteriaceae bacterium]|nr:MAG: hypothetical protein COB98_05670 [Flavobacteriaceae bacterium]
MKKIILSIVFAITLLSSCKDDIGDLFLNPNRSTTSKIEYLFAEANSNKGAGLRENYGTGYALVLPKIFQWTQVTASKTADENMMDLSAGTISTSWTAYYVNFLSKVSEMGALYEKLSEKEQVSYDIYLNLIKIVRANATSKTTDLYGSIPFSEAAKSRLIKNQIIFPKFDTQKEIYEFLLKDLKEVDDFLKSFQFNDEDLVHITLSNQDLLNGGDIDKWIKLNNSLRLRFAMRISDANSELAKTTLKEIVNRPLVLTNEDNILEEAKGPDGLNTNGGDGKFIGRAFKDLNHYAYAGKIMVDIMNESKDPRRAFYFSKNEDGDYVGVPSSPRTKPSGSDITTKEYSKINHELIKDNEFLPGIVITASEVYFLLAEAAMKGYISGNAKEYYDEGLRTSIQFYYNLVKLNTNANPMLPVTSDVDNFINSSTVKHDGTIKQLATQKWIHFGVIQAKEGYADYRRFDYPILEVNYPVVGDLMEMPLRITIPDGERLRNEENYRKIQAADKVDNRVWWDIK